MEATATKLEIAKQPPKSLIAKLAEVMGEIERVPKAGHNNFFNYDYATEADIVAAVRKAMADRRLMLVPTVEKQTWRKVQTKSGTTDLCQLEVLFTVYDGDSDAALCFHVLGEGADSGDKATYKAMTGATKYALLKLFLIPTGDDPERDDAPQGRYTPQAAPKPPPAKTAPKAESPKQSRTSELKEKIQAKQSGEPTPHDKIKKLLDEAGLFLPEDRFKLVRDATGKTKPKDLTDEDAARVLQHIVDMRAQG